MASSILSCTFIRLLVFVSSVQTIFLACGPVPLHVSTTEKVHPNLKGKPLNELTRLFNRKGARSNLYLSVTLWDRSFVEAFISRRARMQSWTPEREQRAVAEWTNRFLKDRTSFRVRLEALDRPLTVQGVDPVLRLDMWQWELWDSEGHRTVAFKAANDSKKLFAGSEGRFSFRVDGNVFFRYRIDSSKVSWIELVALPPGTGGAIKPPKWRFLR